MSDSGPNDFADRLKRIEKKRGVPNTPSYTEGEDFEYPDSNPRRSGARMVLTTVIMGAVIAGGAVAVSLFAPQIMASLRETFSLSANMNTRQPQLSDTPPAVTEPGTNDPRVASRVLTDQGWEMSSPGVATADRAQIVFSDIALGTPPPANAAPAEFATIKTNETCTFRAPAESEVLHNVRIERGASQSDVHAFSNAQMAAALIEHIDGVTSRGNAYKVGTIARGQMANVDVFVTDTSAPVYLALQSFAGGTIWNVHLAEGVTLAHIALIGETSGLAIPEGNTTFEALRISDYVTRIEFGSNDEILPCMIAPWRTPEPHWPAYQKARNGNTLFENQMYSFNTGARAFGEWYTETLGRSPSENLVAVKTAAHVMVGPVPDAPVPHTPLAERIVHLTENDNVILGETRLRELHDEVLARAAGGNIAALTPLPMEVTQ